MRKKERLATLLESLEAEMAALGSCLRQREEPLLGFNWQKKN